MTIQIRKERQLHQQKQQQPALRNELLTAERAVVSEGTNRNLSQAGSDGFNVTWGNSDQIKLEPPKSYKPKSNQATDSTRTDFLHRLVILLPLAQVQYFGGMIR